MSIDNQLLIGTLVFAGLGYYILTNAQPTQQEAARKQLSNDAREILDEFDRLQVRMKEFEANDQKKGRNREITPLSDEDRAGLVEVLTLVKQVEKKQQKTRALDKETAERFHRDVSALDIKARDYLNRYKQNQDSHMKDVRSVTKHPARAATGAAFKRGRISHTRSLSRVAEIAAPTFVADSREKSGKKRKPNFVQNVKPATVLEAPQPSDNRTRSHGSRSAFETNQARDDTEDHAKENADMEEATSSGAHGHNGQHIRPLDASATIPSRGASVGFEMAPGPEADNHDRVQRTSDSPSSTTAQRSTSRPPVVDLVSEISVNAQEEMKRDLIQKMTELRSGTTRLNPSLDERLRTIVSTLYHDDVDGGDRYIQLLRAYALRDKDQKSRKSKRSISAVSLERGKEKLQVREVHEGSRVIISKGGGALPQRSARFGASTAGRTSASRERAFMALDPVSRSRSVSPRPGGNR